MAQPIRIGLVFHSGMAYSRGVLRGIKQYALTQPRWVLVPIEVDTVTPTVLRALHPAGLIALVSNSALAEALSDSGKPLVNVSRILPDQPFPRVSVDHFQVGRLAAAHLRERGLSQFGFVGHRRYVYSTERETGFREGLAEKAPTLHCYHERSMRSYQRRGRLLALDDAFQQWLRSLPKPVGVFACQDMWGFQAAEACHLADLRVPDEVAILGVDNDDLLCELARPSLSSVVIPAERIGYEASALLARLLNGAAPPARPLLIQPLGIVTRQSSDVLALDDADVVAAVRFIREHAHQPISVGDVLREVPLSRRALERRFRRALNRRIGEEIRRVHVERAKSLLAGTELSVAAVAKQAGFSGATHLCVVFRQETGLTPTEHRHRLRG